MSTSKAEWSIAAAGISLALLVWFARGTPSAGGRVEYVFTVVPADASGTACATSRTISAYHCEFDEADKATGSVSLLAPFVTVNGEQVLLAGVFDGPAMVEWLNISKLAGSAERITVRCAGRLLGVMDAARIRWTPTSPWGSATGLSAAVVDGCSVVK